MQFHSLQHAVIPLDWNANRASIETQLSALDPKYGDVVVLSEMSDTGWSMEIDSITDIGTVAWATGISEKFSIWIQVGWARREGDKATNCVTICSPDGDEVATYAKTFTCNPFSEHEQYGCGDELLIVDIGACRICPMICYDLRFPELWRPAAIQGVDVFTVSSSWPLARIGQWRGLLVGRAIENQAFIVASNRIGKDDLASWGGDSIIISPFGDVICEGSFAEVETISANVDPEVARAWRKEFPVFEDVKKDLIGKIRVRSVTA